MFRVTVKISSLLAKVLTFREYLMGDHQNKKITEMSFTRILQENSISGFCLKKFMLN